MDVNATQGQGFLRAATKREAQMWFHCCCGQRLRAPKAAAGKPARCPRCQLVFTVPRDPGVQTQGSAILDALRGSAA
jgi:uncharacterized paraquat-inducible protein A